MNEDDLLYRPEPHHKDTYNYYRGREMQYERTESNGNTEPGKHRNQL